MVLFVWSRTSERKLNHSKVMRNSKQTLHLLATRVERSLNERKQNASQKIKQNHKPSDSSPWYVSIDFGDKL